EVLRGDHLQRALLAAQLALEHGRDLGIDLSEGRGLEVLGKLGHCLATLPTGRDRLVIARTRRAAFLVASATLALTAPAAAQPSNPCKGPEAKHLLCPNLRIGAPAELYVQRTGGRMLLRATSNVKSRGRGPMELHGHRNGRRSMRVNQRIYRTSGGHITVR